MAAQKGLSVLISVSSDGTSSGTFTAVGGITSASIAFNQAEVDVTSADDATRWQQLLAGAGVKSAAVSGSGVFKDDAVDESLRAHFFDGTNAYLELTIPDFGVVDGPFHIGSLEYTGEHAGAAGYSVSLSGAGDLTWNAAA